MNLEIAKKITLDAIKKLWKDDVRYVSVKKIKEVLEIEEAHRTNILLGKALQKINLHSEILRLFAKSPNKYKILKKPEGSEV